MKLAHLPLGVFFCSMVAFAQQAPITAFRQISDGLYRSARPGDAGIDAVAAMGMKTVLDLENDDKVVAEERAHATALGLKFISKPMSGFWEPHDAEVNEILAIVADTSNYPMLVHCHLGEDRTGLIIGLYRVFQQHWTPRAAYSEMLADGFHPRLFLLHHYFEDKTRFEN
jgi:protein tyrosine/serine phosphatase